MQSTPLPTITTIPPEIEKARENEFFNYVDTASHVIDQQWLGSQRSDDKTYALVEPIDNRDASHPQIKKYFTSPGERALKFIFGQPVYPHVLRQYGVVVDPIR